MFKVIAFAVFLAVAAAAPGFLKGSVSYTAPVLRRTILPTIVKTAVVAEPTHVEIQHPYIERVGLVHSIPTAVSHQSQTILHHDKVITPVLTPVVRTYNAPLFKTVLI